MIFVEEGELYGTASTALVALALATTCSLNLNVDSFDATSKDSGSWQASLPGMKSWNMSTDNLYSPKADTMLALAINRTKLKLYWCPAENTEALNQVSHDPTLDVDGDSYKYYVGEAWINSFTANAANGEASNFTVNFTGTGALTPSDALPSAGIGVSQTNLRIAKSGSANVVVSNFSGTLSATTSNAKVTTAIANGVVKISVASDCPAGAYVVTVADTGTSSTAYVFVTVPSA